MPVSQLRGAYAKIRGLHVWIAGRDVEFPAELGQPLRTCLDQADPRRVSRTLATRRVGEGQTAEKL